MRCVLAWQGMQRMAQAPACTLAMVAAAVQHYAVQAVDNLLTRQGPWASCLACEDTAASLLHILGDCQVRLPCARTTAADMLCAPVLCGCL